MRRDETRGKTVTEIADIFFARLANAKAQLQQVNEPHWKVSFAEAVRNERRELEAVWETRWMADCDGKRLLEDIRKSVTLNMDLRRFKTRIMKEMQATQSETWKAVKALLVSLLEVKA